MKEVWQKISAAIVDHLVNGKDLVLPELKEDHKGAFLALFDKKGDLIGEVKVLQDGLADLSETLRQLCKNAEEEKKRKECVAVHLCVIKGAIHIRNPLEWDASRDGVCFQWGNRYRGFLMPYEIALMGGDKIRIMDRLSSRMSLPSSLWKIPESMTFKIAVDWYR